MIVKSSRNAIHNCTNPYQGNYKKVLCICSAGLLRSPTAANILHKEFGFNTRSAGLREYVLIPVSEVLIKWADEIVVMEKLQAQDLMKDIEEFDLDVSEKTLIILNIPDNFDYMDKTLEKLIISNYKEAMYKM